MPSSSPVTREELRDLLDAKIGGLNARFTEVREDIGAISGKVDGVKADTSKHEVRLTSIEGRLDYGAVTMRGMVHRRDVALVVAVVTVIGGAVWGGFELYMRLRELSH